MQELASESELVFVKGDANYRRLIGDRRWATDIPFADVAGYFPTRLCALRTLKAELGYAPSSRFDDIAGTHTVHWIKTCGGVTAGR